MSRRPDETPEVGEEEIALVEVDLLGCEHCGHQDHEADGCPNVPIEWLDRGDDEDEGDEPWRP